MTSDTSAIKIGYLGTFHPAVPTFQALADRGWVAVVIMPEDAGYKNSELMAAAQEWQIPWSYNLNDIENFSPNILIAANYPKIVPKRYLEAYHCINTHWSLLPRWRGIHSTAWALINGDEEIGLSVHKMGEEFDVGDILAQASVQMTPDMTFNELHETLAQMQAVAVISVLEEFERTGKFSSQVQDETLATYVPQRMPEDGIIHWGESTRCIEALVKALPLPKYPGAFTYLNHRKLVIARARAVDCPAYYSTVGQVVRIKDNSAWVKTGDTCLAVEEVMFEDEGVVYPAASVLKRGMKLGYDVQLELSALRQEINALRDEVHRLSLQGEQ